MRRATSFWRPARAKGHAPTWWISSPPGGLRGAYKTARPKDLAADAWFDSKRSHQLARGHLGIQSLIIPTHGRPTTKEPTGRYRRRLKRHLQQSRYTQRWQVETVISMIKRCSGDVVDARHYWERSRLLLLRTPTNNLAIL